jgi:hypothetical protein
VVTEAVAEAMQSGRRTKLLVELAVCFQERGDRVIGKVLRTQFQRPASATPAWLILDKQIKVEAIFQCLSYGSFPWTRANAAKGVAHRTRRARVLNHRENWSIGPATIEVSPFDVPLAGPIFFAAQKQSDSSDHPVDLLYDAGDFRKKRFGFSNRLFNSLLTAKRPTKRLELMDSRDPLCTFDRRFRTRMPSISAMRDLIAPASPILPYV